MLNVNNIEVIYDDVILVLKGLSLEVTEGQIVALLGANGAGKTTTLKAISGLLKVEEGDIFRPEVLGKLRDITRDLREVSGVNQFQIISLASKKLKGATSLPSAFIEYRTYVVGSM